MLSLERVARLGREDRAAGPAGRDTPPLRLPSHLACLSCGLLVASRAEASAHSSESAGPGAAEQCAGRPLLSVFLDLARHDFIPLLAQAQAV